MRLFFAPIHMDASLCVRYFLQAGSCFWAGGQVWAVPQGFTLLDMVRLQTAIERQLGVAADVLTAGDVPARFREQAAREAKPIMNRNLAQFGIPVAYLPWH